MKNRAIIIVCMFSIFFCAGQRIAEHIKNPKLRKITVGATRSFMLEPTISEGSGLIGVNGTLLTHNDSGSSSLFVIDSASGKRIGEYALPISNYDWEDMSQDKSFIYLGAFGNNYGKRDTLQIYRIDKSSLATNKISIDSISFTWPAIRRKGRKKFNFDCEAMAIVNDSIFLFTKEWKGGRKSRVFAIPNKPGHHRAEYRFTLNTNLLITGASYNESRKQLVLCGYSVLLKPYLLVFPFVAGTDFFRKGGTKIKIKRKYRQAEGVTTFDGITYYVVNERFKFWIFKSRPYISVYKITADK